jgi:dUTP pyrophosphatase
MKVKFKKLHKDAVVPKYSKEGDCGLDLTAVAVKWDYYHDYIEYDTGIAVEIPPGYCGLCMPRSSNSNKDLLLSNSVGLIDQNYRGSIRFRYKRSKEPDRTPLSYAVGDRIGQLLIVPCPVIETEEVEELSDTNRGSDSFGASGA